MLANILLNKQRVTQWRKSGTLTTDTFHFKAPECKIKRDRDKHLSDIHQNGKVIS